MTSRIIHNQTKTHGRDMGLSLCGGESRAPMPACGQGGVHSFPIGASSFRSSRLLDAPPLTGRGFALRSFSHSRRARLVLPDVAPGRFARDPLIGRTVYKFSAALLIGRSHQLNRIGHKPGSDIADPLHVRLSKFVSFNADEPTEMTSGTILYQYGEILKVQGAPQHEFG